MVRKFTDLDILDETGSRWTESVEYLESIVATMKAALVRLEVSEDRALGRSGLGQRMTTNPTPLAQAIDRHKAAQAALDAVPGPEDWPDHLSRDEVRPSTNSPSRLAPAMRNSSKSCATFTLSKRKYGTCRTMATITVVSPSPPHVTSVR